jgi:molybdopterin-guanine dinucleotide biosynthesis protein A
MIKIPGMLMVGAGDRNAGKTRFVCSLIKRFCPQHNIIGIKVTTIEQDNGSCPRGGAGCGVCSTLEGNFCITEETDRQSNKDTCKMLASGATRVFWLRALKTHLKEGITALQDVIGDDVNSICESNSLRQVVEPGLFVMLKGQRAAGCKASAKNVARYADRIVIFDGKNFNINTDEIELVDGKWANKMEATAIIMAGGKSMRMGQDKSMLLVNGEPVIKHIFEQLCSHFNQVLISSDDISGYSFLGVEVVGDEVTGKGPLMGIASALKASVNQVNFVIACDIPEVDISFVRQMVRESKGFDAVVPQTRPSQYEPLFAVYNKSALAAIDKAIALENYRIIAPLKDCKVNYINLASGQQLKNLNTRKDYHKFIGNNNNVAI